MLWGDGVAVLLRGIQHRRARWPRPFEHALTRALKRSRVDGGQLNPSLSQ
jgi:hypothetical protein